MATIVDQETKLNFVVDNGQIQNIRKRQSTEPKIPERTITRAQKPP